MQPMLTAVMVVAVTLGPILVAGNRAERTRVSILCAAVMAVGMLDGVFAITGLSSALWAGVIVVVTVADAAHTRARRPRAESAPGAAVVHRAFGALAMALLMVIAAAGGAGAEDAVAGHAHAGSNLTPAVLGLAGVYVAVSAGLAARRRTGRWSAAEMACSAVAVGAMAVMHVS